MEMTINGALTNEKVDADEHQGVSLYRQYDVQHVVRVCRIDALLACHSIS